MFIIPWRASLIWLLLVPSSLPIGFVIASWILPIILAVNHDGLHGLSEIPVDWWGLAHAPTWFENGKAVDAVTLILGLVIVIPLGKYLEGLWEKIGIKRGWMTKEELERYKNARQIL